MLDMIIAAAAEAVFGKALDAAWTGLRLDERLLGRVKVDPARVAFKKALARAYVAFARSHPDLGGALFTEPFLAGAAAPELAQLLAGRDPDAARFAQLWVREPRCWM